MGIKQSATNTWTRLQFLRFSTQLKKFTASVKQQNNSVSPTTAKQPWRQLGFARQIRIRPLLKNKVDIVANLNGRCRWPITAFRCEQWQTQRRSNVTYDRQQRLSVPETVDRWVVCTNRQLLATIIILNIGWTVLWNGWVSEKNTCSIKKSVPLILTFFQSKWKLKTKGNQLGSLRKQPWNEGR